MTHHVTSRVRDRAMMAFTSYLLRDYAPQMVKLRRHLWERRWNDLFRQQLLAKLNGAWRFQCFYCRKPIKRIFATLEHLIPSSWGGAWEPGNLVLACPPCNQMQGHRTNNIPPHEREAYAREIRAARDNYQVSPPADKLSRPHPDAANAA